MNDVPIFKRGDRHKYVIDEESGCWLWMGALSGHGYGRLKVNRRVVGAHRYHWEEVNGPVPNGMELDHKCNRTNCVNPKHLRLMTRTDNATRANMRRWRGQDDVEAPF